MGRNSGESQGNRIAMWALGVAILSLLVATGTPFTARLWQLDHESDLRVIDAYSYTDGDLQHIDVVLRNVGDEVAVVTRFELFIEETWRLRDSSLSCQPHRPNREIPFAWLRGKGDATTRIVSEKVLVDDAAHLSYSFNDVLGANETRIHKVKMELVFDEAQRRVGTPSLLLIFQPFPDSGPYKHSDCISEEELAELHAENFPKAREIMAAGARENYDVTSFLGPILRSAP